MSTYYVYGHPCSDELYHHGIAGQKWGVRRFQNVDGTLTPAGKERYYPDSVSRKPGVLSNVGRAVKNSAQRLGDKIKRSVKIKHPWLMDDDELRRVVSRAQMEKSLRDLEKDRKGSTFVGQLLRDSGKITMTAAESFARTFYSKSGEFAAKKIFKVDEKGNNNRDDKKDDDD